MEKEQDIKKAGIVFHRYGPYHICRINALHQFYNTIGFELSGITKEYKWDKIASEQQFKRITLFEDKNSRDADTSLLKKKINEALQENKVDVMLINGWGDKGGLLFLKWCLQHRIPTILMTEEIEQTFARTWVKEYPKRKIVQLFDAALVGGKLQKSYVEKLGMPTNLIESGYDVIDNYYFENKTKIALQNREALLKQYSLPENFFLTSNRFIEKKNLFRLLEAYKKYLDIAGNNKWHLVMLGDGPLKAELIKKIQTLQLVDYIIMPGFLQYDTLPDYYALSKAFIHASTSEQWGLVVNEAMACGLPVIVSDKCGCSEDLVEDGNNGYIFDPFDVDKLAEKMYKLSFMDLDSLQRMGNESKKIISRFSPEIFGKSVSKLIQKIKQLPNNRKPVLNKILLNISIRLSSY